MTNFKQKYNPEIHHRRTIRLKGFDYSQSGAYFVTLCIEGRRCILGEIQDRETELSPVGEIVRKFWMEVPTHYQQMSLDEFIVMPNHIHGIIIINKTNQPVKTMGVQSVGVQSVVVGVEVQNFEPLPQPRSQPQPARPSTSKPAVRQYHQYQHIIPATVGSMIRAYKGAVTMWCRRNGYEDFKWQRNFYEHIIRNEDELRRIRDYIVNNPVWWQRDKLKPS